MRFDKGMLSLYHLIPHFAELFDYRHRSHTGRQVIAFMRGDGHPFAFNSGPTENCTDYLIEGVPAGQYELPLDSDVVACGDFGRTDVSVLHHTRVTIEGGIELRLYLPSHSAQVYQRRR